MEEFGRPAADLRMDQPMTVHIRRARPDDERAVRSMLTLCSAATLHLRFLSPLAVPPSPDDATAHVIADLLIGERGEGDATYVAIDGNDVVGVGEMRVEGEQSAEVAFLVPDGRQGQGIGTALVRRIAADARRQGKAVLTAHMFGENTVMLGAFRSAGQRPVRETRAGFSTLTIPLDDVDDTV